MFLGIRLPLPYNIYDGNRCFGRSEIVMMTGPDARTAYRRLVCSIVGAYVSDACAEFQIPSGPYQPLVAVADSCSVIPSLMPGVAAVSEQSERSADIPDIEFSPMHVQTEEMSVEFFTEPVAGFRLNEEVLPFHVVLEIPAVPVPGYVQCPFGRKSKFDPPMLMVAEAS